MRSSRTAWRAATSFGMAGRSSATSASGRSLTRSTARTSRFTPRTAAAAQASQQEIARGRYVFGATGGCGCHTAKAQPANAGGRRYDGLFGTVYSSNITPDRETGIGAWTDEQIITATRLGRRPNGDRLLPVHPYPVFNGMAAEDLKALVVFLRSVPPVTRGIPR